MPRSAEEERAEGAARASSLSDELLGLASRLVREAATVNPGAGVLLDVEVDGVRVVLTAQREFRTDHTLSPREREIARMVAEGYPNKTIAAVLDISSWTVSTYVRRIFAKLGVRTRAAMVARVLEEGLVAQPLPQHDEELRLDRDAKRT